MPWEGTKKPRELLGRVGGLDSEILLVLVLSAAFAMAFSWRLHFLEAHTADDWPHFNTSYRWTPPSHLQPWVYGVSHWGLESRFWSPWHLLHPLCGQALGVNLELPIHLALAFSGGWVLARVLGMGRLAALTSAVVFPSSSWIYLHFVAGHLSFLPFAYMPWMVAAFLTNTRWATVGLAGLMALAFFEGGVYPIIESSVLLAVLALMRRGRVVAIARLLLAAALTLVLATPKLLQIPQIGPRLMSPAGAIPLAACLHSFISPTAGARGEYGFYLSPFILLLVAAGLGPTIWTVAAALMLALGIGDYFGPWSPYCLLHRVPLISWTQYPQRWFISAVFCFGVLAAHGSERLSKTRAGTVVATLLLALGLVNCWIVSTAWLGLIK